MEFPSDLSRADLVSENDSCWMFGFPQGSAQWGNARLMAIGGSGIYALLGKSEYITRYKAIALMVSGGSIEITVPIARGIVGESYVRNYLSDRLGINIREIGIAVKKDAPWMRASPDGIYDLPGGGIGIVEIKVISSRARTAPYYNTYVKLGDGVMDVNPPIHDEHWHQVHYVAGVMGAKEVTYCVLCWNFDGAHTGKQGPFIYCVRFVPGTYLFEKIHVPTARNAYQQALARK